MGQLGSHTRKHNLATNYTFHKNEFKIHHRAKYEVKNCKTLEDNVRENLHDLQYGDNILDTTLQT